MEQCNVKLASVASDVLGVSALAILVFAGGTAGVSGAPLKVVESFSAPTSGWTTLAALPKAVIGPGAAAVNGLLYCFGGSNNGVLGQGTVYNSP